MAKAPLQGVVRHIRKIVDVHMLAEATDGHLVERFVRNHEESAFAVLLRRHGPMVLGVCRGVLGQREDAEDVFQATFLLLARKATSIRKRESVASWLYGVAYRLATRAKEQRALRRSQEIKASTMRRTAPSVEEAWRELHPLLHEEMEKLPEKYRTALVLFYWEGKTQEEVARELGCPVGTVQSRLGRGRKQLRERLTRRGLDLSVCPFAAFLVAGIESVPVQATLLDSTLKACVQLGSAAGVVSAPVAALVEEGLKAMLSTKLKIATALLLAVSFVAGAGALAHQAFEAKPSETKQATAPKSATQEPNPRVPEQPRTDLQGDPLPEGAVARIGTSRLCDSTGTTVIAFSQDGHRLAYGNENGLIHVCEAADGKPLLDLQIDQVNFNPVTELAFSPDGRTLAVGGYWYEALWLIDLATRKVRHTIPNTAPGQNLWGREWQGPGFTFTPDGGTLIVGGKDGALHLWDPVSGTEQAALRETTEPVLSLALTANGQAALTAHRDGALHLWDVASRKHLRKLAGSTKLPYLYLTALAPDGKTVALASEAAVLELWDPDGGRRHQLRTAAPVVGLGFTPDGASLLVADGDGCVTVWDVQTGKQRKALTCEGVSLRGPNGHVQPRPSAWFRSDGKVMAWAVVGAVRLWNLATGQETPRLLLYPQGIGWAGFSADGRLLYAGGLNGELGVWDATTGRQHGTLRKTPPTPGARYAPAADRRRVVVVTSSSGLVTKPQPGEGRIFLWDPTGDDGPVQLCEQSEPVGNAALTPDHRFVAVPQATGRIQVYDATTGKPARSFDGHKNEYRPTFSPDGVLLATTAADGVIRLYDFASGRLLRELKAQLPAGCFAFSPDSWTLASGHFTSAKESGPSGEAIYLWDTASGRELQRIPTKHGGAVQALSFSSDGRLLASCGLDGAVRLWESASGQERRRYQGHRSWALSIDFAPDGDRLASASLDGTAVVWQVFGPAPAGLAAADSEVLWADLARDGITAHRAIGALVAAPGQALPLLRERLRPAVPADPRRVARLIAELDSERFAVREKATKELEQLGDLAGPLLRKAREGVVPLERRQRLDQLLVRLQGPVVSPEPLRNLRAVEVLEQLGRTEARHLLRELAKGAGEARLTREAKATLERLERR